MAIKTRAALLIEAPGEWDIREVQLDPPRQDELLLRMVAAGLCHSDDHMATGDSRVPLFPIAGGHEGAGIVEEVGPGTVAWEVGDHVVLSFLPACGRCRFCATGHQNLCDRGADLLSGGRADGSFRVSFEGRPVAQFCGLGTFAERTVVSVDSAVKVDPDLSLETVVLTGCGVGTGWGSAVNSAGVRPGDTVIVMGIGGVGINAVQGAAHAGAANVIAVDPIPFKRETALQLGATRACESMDQATEIARAYTNGQGADSAIVTVGVVTGEHVAEAFSAIRKAGTVVVTALGRPDRGIPIRLTELTLYEKRLQGSLFGGSSPSWDIPRQLELYRAGLLKLDELVTHTYNLDQINEGYLDMHAGKNIRGVIVFD